MRDFKSGDKIALAGIKTSLVAVVIQIIAAKGFGHDSYVMLVPLIIALAKLTLSFFYGTTILTKSNRDHIHRLGNWLIIGAI